MLIILGTKKSSHIEVGAIEFILKFNGRPNDLEIISEIALKKASAVINFSQSDGHMI